MIPSCTIHTYLPTKRLWRERIGALSNSASLGVYTGDLASVPVQRCSPRVGLRREAGVEYNEHVIRTRR